MSRVRPAVSRAMDWFGETFLAAAPGRVRQRRLPSGLLPLGLLLTMLLVSIARAADAPIEPAAGASPAFARYTANPHDVNPWDWKSRSAGLMSGREIERPYAAGPAAGGQ
jgi:hypothetical protein